MKKLKWQLFRSHAFPRSKPFWRSVCGACGWMSVPHDEEPAIEKECPNCLQKERKSMGTQRNIGELLAAIKERCDAATEGPWDYDAEENGLRSEDDNHTQRGQLGDYRSDALLVTRASGVQAWPANDADGEFIAASRTDVPLLVKLVQYYRGLVYAGEDDYGEPERSSYIDEGAARVLAGEEDGGRTDAR